MGRIGKKLRGKRLKQALADIEINLINKTGINLKRKRENDQMDIKIENCNSIDRAEIKIYKGKINIKFGINGTGKSTISKAIHYKCTNEEKLQELLPFKYIENNDGNISPKVTGADEIESVRAFNETYINQFVFKQDELILNSFEIFIKNEDYNKKLQEIEKIIISIKSSFEHNENIDKVINDLSELSDCFGKSKGGYSAASSIGKGLGKGNKIEHIPEGLESYTDFLRSDKNTQWIKWQIGGNVFSEISNSCPYCTSATEDKKESIRRVENEFDAKAIEHLIKVLSVVERLDKYFSDEAKSNIFSITKNKVALSKEEINYLKHVKEQIDTFREKLNTIKGVTFFTFEDVDTVIEKIKSLKINIELLPLLNSESSSNITKELNSALDNVLQQAGKLQGQVNLQKAGIRKTINERKDEMNNFLKFAGYQYSVDLEGDSRNYKLKLLHHDMSGAVAGGDQHLSYGEKNAFALVLFMYECLSASPDLIILDDPISSFDKNKKYALLEMLFRGKNSLRGKTVLMLTHDLEPIIDLVKTIGAKLFNPVPTASFLTSRQGIVTEQIIEKSDIKTFAQLCEENISSNEEVVIKLIYLRRLYEAINDKGSEYQLLSNLFHKRETPVDMSEENTRNMTDSEILKATTAISDRVNNFDYAIILNRITNIEQMTSIYNHCLSDYEKLQIFRTINDSHENNIIRKYINESFHIENEYICQLNPCKYEIIPEFIVKECDAFFEQA